MSLDEWNIRHVEPAAWPDPQPSADGGTVARDVDGLPTAPAHRVNRWSPRTLADALFYAGVFHALHRAGGRHVRVAMANTVNLLNANGVIVARPGGAVRAATYHVWDLYQNHLGPVALSADVRSPGRLTAVRQGDERDRRGEFRSYPATVPDLDVSATQTTDGRSLRVAVINRHRDTRGKRPFRHDSRVATLARAKSRDMVERNYFDHRDTRGRYVDDHLRRAGIRFSRVGEIIAWGRSDDLLSSADEAVRLWMHSAPHKRQILTDNVYFGAG